MKICLRGSLSWVSLSAIIICNQLPLRKVLLLRLNHFTFHPFHPLHSVLMKHWSISYETLHECGIQMNTCMYLCALLFQQRRVCLLLVNGKKSLAGYLFNPYILYMMRTPLAPLLFSILSLQCHLVFITELLLCYPEILSIEVHTIVQQKSQAVSSFMETKTSGTKGFLLGFKSQEQKTKQYLFMRLKLPTIIFPPPTLPPKNQICTNPPVLINSTLTSFALLLHPSLSLAVLSFRPLFDSECSDFWFLHPSPCNQQTFFYFNHHLCGVEGWETALNGMWTSVCSCSLLWSLNCNSLLLNGQKMIIARENPGLMKGFVDLQIVQNCANCDDMMWGQTKAKLSIFRFQSAVLIQTCCTCKTSALNALCTTPFNPIIKQNGNVNI